MKSVPPRGSGWVVDSELVSADISRSSSEKATEATRYREMVLTSCHWKEHDCQCLIIEMLVKLHQ